MSYVATTSTLREADHAAEKLLEYLAPACEVIEVAGSVRRRQDSIGDIEVVAIPRIERSAEGALFEQSVDRLAQVCDQVEAGKLRGLKRAEPNPKSDLPLPASGKRRRFAWGDKWKRLVVHDAGRWFVVDLFICKRSNYGPTLAIRTGPSDFSRLLVTSRDKGGAMPRGHRQHEGHLEHQQDGPEWQPLYVPTEADYFELLGLPVWDPRVRSERLIRAELAKQGAGR